MSKKTAAISARVTPETKERLNAYAERLGEKATDIIEAAIHYYLDTQENNATQDETHTEDNAIQDETHTEDNAIQDEIHTEDNAIQDEIQESKDVTQNATHQLEQRLEALEDEIKKLRIDTNGNADKLNQLEENALTSPDMEGVSCNIAVEAVGETMHPPTESDNWEPLMTLNEVEEKYGNGKPHPKILNQKELAARLKKGSSSLTEARKRGKFSEWSKQYDPEGIAWEYGSDKKYHPIPK